MEFFSSCSGGRTERGQRKMSSKAEYKRTVKKLKEREGSVAGVVFTRKRKHRMTGKKVTMSEAELTGPKQDFGLPVVDERRKRKGGWKKVDKAPLVRQSDVGKLAVTNGLELPNWVVLIKQVRDVKVAKKVARLANSWYRKLYGLDEIRMVQTFNPGDDVWWTKKGQVVTGVVSRLKTRKLAVKTGQGLVDTVILPIRKVKKGPVPKEYLYPDPKRWRVGRMKGGEKRLAEAVVQ